MANYYVHPSGTGTTQAQMQNAATPAPSINRLFAAVSAGTGFVEGDVVYVSGIIRGTAANPERSFANYNFAGNPAGAVGVTFTPWTTAEPNPGALTISQPFLRGDVPITGGSWTASGNTYTYTLATGLDLTAVLFRWGRVVEQQGRHFGHLKWVVDAATVATTDNSWFYDSATGVLTIRITDRFGTLLSGAGSAPSTSASTPDVSFVIGNTSTPALICLQNANRCTIRGFMTANAYQTNGTYQLCTSDSSNCVIEDCHSIDGASHHYFGHTGTPSPAQTGNVIRRCSGRGYYGAATTLDSNTGSFSPFFVVGRPATNHVVEDCEWYAHVVLSPSCQPLFTAKTPSAGFITSLDGSTTESPTYPMSGCVMRRNVVRHTNPTAHAGGGAFILVNGAYAPATFVATDPSTYPLVIEDCSFENVHAFAFGGAGTAQTQHVAMRRCLIDLRGVGSAWTSASPTPTCTAMRWTTISGTKYCLFERCVIVINSDHFSAGFQGHGIEVNTGNTVRFRGCTIIDVGLRSVGQVSNMFRYATPSGSGTFIVEDSIIAFANATGTRRLIANEDAAWTATEAKRQFSGNCYVNVGTFMADTDFDTAAEFLNTSTGIDRTGVAINGCVFSDPYTYGLIGAWANKSELRNSALSSMTSRRMWVPHSTGGVKGATGDYINLWGIQNLRGRG
jgi:hypothetical protein